MSAVTQTTIETVWRIERPRLIGGLVRFTRSVDTAEDLAQDALLAALEHWPNSGVPDNPGAWLMTTARHRALDAARRTRMAETKLDEIARQTVSESPPAQDAIGEVGDDVLRLMLVACHPVLPKEGRVALTLRLLGGLTTEEIARAFLVPEPTMAQRIVRAKRTITEARVPFEVPDGPALLARLPSVFEVLYLIFNEGYAATAGEDWMRPALCEEALRLGRVLAALVPDEPEAHGLSALMSLQASRMRARTDKQGNPILLLDQNRSHWDRMLIQHGLAALERAMSLRQPLGVYTLQAGIAGCHARAATAQATDWARIVALYDALVEITQSPVVELNRAAAVGMAFGAAEALTLVDHLVQDGSLARYHLLYATRADLLAKLSRFREAATDSKQAAQLTDNAREKTLLLARADELVRQATKPPLS